MNDLTSSTSSLAVVFYTEFTLKPQNASPISPKAGNSKPDPSNFLLLSNIHLRFIPFTYGISYLLSLSPFIAVISISFLPSQTAPHLLPPHPLRKRAIPTPFSS